MAQTAPDAGHGVSVTGRVRENIQAIDELKQEADRAVTSRQRLIERAARFIATPRTLFVLLGASASWLALNVYLLRSGRAPYDPPPFFWLQGALGLFAAVITTMVLIAQTRQSQDADRRAHLELHVNLLAEQKVTKIIALLEELRRDMPNVHNREDPTAKALAEDVDPKVVHSALDTETDKR